MFSRAREASADQNLYYGAQRSGNEMAKHSMKNYMRGDIDHEQLLGTLAAKTLISQVVDDTVTESTLCTSIECSYSMGNVTPRAQQGPVLFGVAHSDYTDSEIEAVIESSSSWTKADLVAQEVAKRLIRKIGQFEMLDGSTPLSIAVLNDGKPIKTKLNWRLETGQTLRFWAYNLGSAAFATTDPSVDVQGHANLFVL